MGDEVNESCKKLLLQMRQAFKRFGDKGIDQIMSEHEPLFGTFKVRLTGLVLRQECIMEAATVHRLTRGQEVQVQARAGLWIQCDAGGFNGWALCCEGPHDPC